MRQLKIVQQINRVHPIGVVFHGGGHLYMSPAENCLKTSKTTKICRVTSPSVRPEMSFSRKKTFTAAGCPLRTGN